MAITTYYGLLRALWVSNAGTGLAYLRVQAIAANYVMLRNQLTQASQQAVQNPNAGKILYTANNPRQIQFALKLTF